MLDKQNETLGRGLRRFVQWLLHLGEPWQAPWAVAFILMWVWIEWPEAVPYLLRWLRLLT